MAGWGFLRGKKRALVLAGVKEGFRDSGEFYALRDALFLIEDKVEEVEKSGERGRGIKILVNAGIYLNTIGATMDALQHAL